MTIEKKQENAKSGHLQLVDVVKTFGTGSKMVTAVDKVNLDIAPGEFITLLGPSGCGKTTTLRMVAGFEDSTSGQVLLDGEDMVSVPPNQRPMAMVFQSYALFPHMTVRGNVEYGLKLKKMPKEQMAKEVDEALEAMNLTAMQDRAPNQLSGGQQQRVALARALVMKPKVLLFDEPLSNLDAKLRVKMRLEIRRLQRQLGITSLYVTHDQSEAMTMSDRVVIMHDGKIEQVATPEEIYRHPASVFVADFIGRANFLPATVHEINRDQTTNTAQAKVSLLGVEETLAAGPNVMVEKPAVVVVRPESLVLRAVDENRREDARGEVTSAVFYGDHVEYVVETKFGSVVSIESDPDPTRIHSEGSLVSLDYVRERCWVLPAPNPTTA